MSNPYWNATKQAKLELKDVSASWAAPGKSHSLTRTHVCNRAFEIYYKAKKIIADCPNVQQTTAMDKELSNAATAGWGVGIDDLEEAFEHLHKNNGKWTDNKTTNYYGGPNKSINRMLVTEVPVSIVNFLTEVDKGMQKVASATREYNLQLPQFKRASDADDWTKLKDYVDKAKSAAEKVHPWMWTDPIAVQRDPMITKIGGWTKTTISFLDVTSKIHDSLTMYTKAQSAGFDARSAGALAALKVACDCVPVLGSFYGKMVEMIPGLAVNWRNFIEDYTRKRLHPERYQ